MDVSILFSGEFGRRFVINLACPWLCPYLGACGVDRCDYCKKYDYSSSIAMVHEFAEPSSYGIYIDDVRAILPEFLSADVMIAINLHPDILIELPSIISEYGYKALIVPVEDPKWCSAGLRKQIEKECNSSGIEFTSPKPLCTLKPESKRISKFCSLFRFGMPEFDVRMDGNTVERVEVKADTCGCAYYVAKMMEGYRIVDVNEFWKEIHQHQCAYPCMASMERDVEIVEAPFHLAGYVMVYSFSKAVKIDATDFIPEYMRKFIL